MLNTWGLYYPLKYPSAMKNILASALNCNHLAEVLNCLDLPAQVVIPYASDTN